MTTLSTVLAAGPEAPSTASPTIAAASGLAPYTGPFTVQEASHLLSRTTFGGTVASIEEAVGLGLEATLDQLLAERPLPPPPVAQEENGGVPVGETWINAPYPAGAREKQAAVGVRARSMRAWLNQLRLDETISVTETMVLFWHNHFANNNFNEPRWNYLHSSLLRREALGNFRRLVKDMTIDSVMLAFLDGTRSTRRSPNENYARELLELFTLGKGPQVGPGDYTNYTEDDVLAMARSLTGWRVQGYRSEEGDQSYLPVFVPARHDPETVQLSHRFGNRQLESSGENTYADLVDVIFEHEAAADYLIRKLYRWFVYYEITPEVETSVIQPLAAIFRENDFELVPVLRTLFSSQHFFDVYAQGPMLKHPIRFTVGLMRQLEIEPIQPNQPPARFPFALFQRSNQMGMGDFRAPTVAGWKAFYQEPLYYRDWINSATLPLRNRLGDQLFANNSRVQNYGGVRFSLLNIVNRFESPIDVWGMIDQWVTLLFPRPVPESQREFLKDILLPGLPDTQWATEYADYQANPNDENLARALETNLRRMVKTMLEMPEYQLC